jgi:hypothetical protein
MRLFTFFCLLAVIFTACQPAKKDVTQEGKGTTSDPVKEKIYFRCDVNVNKETDEPHSQVFLVVNEEATKVADIAACETIQKAEYNRYNMPANTLSACGGWWAGAGDYLYAIKIGDQIAVLQGSEDESSTAAQILYTIVATVPITNQ